MRHYKIIVGSKRYLESCLSEEERAYENFLKFMKYSDTLRTILPDAEKTKVDNLIIENNHYQAIREESHSCLGLLIEDLTTEDAKIVIHNPTRVLTRYLVHQYDRGVIEIETTREELPKLSDLSPIREDHRSISRKIADQNKAIEELVESIHLMAKSDLTAPYVIMLYGPCNIGKTQAVHEIAARYYKTKILERHLSLFRDNEYLYYLFGNKPNIHSLGFDLLERESNLVFLDEFDRCPPYCLSAFYTLFDNCTFRDFSYDVDISNLLVILTTSYRNERDIRRELGDSIFYRIDKFIKFEPLSDTAIDTIAKTTADEIAKNLYSVIWKRDL